MIHQGTLILVVVVVRLIWGKITPATSPSSSGILDRRLLSSHSARVRKWNRSAEPMKSRVQFEAGGRQQTVTGGTRTALPARLSQFIVAGVKEAEEKRERGVQ